MNDRDNSSFRTISRDCQEKLSPLFSTLFPSSSYFSITVQYYTALLSLSLSLSLSRCLILSCTFSALPLWWHPHIFHKHCLVLRGRNIRPSPNIDDRISSRRRATLRTCIYFQCEKNVKGADSQMENESKRASTGLHSLNVANGLLQRTLRSEIAKWSQLSCGFMYNVRFDTHAFSHPFYI